MVITFQRLLISHRRFITRWLVRTAAIFSTIILLSVYLTVSETPQKSKYVLKLTVFDQPPTMASIVREDMLTTGSNVMIVSYMRGGSSMSGQVFRDNEDDFYVYEPLIQLAPYQYLTENRYCEMRTLKCSIVVNATTGEMVKERIESSVETLKNIYNCNIRKLNNNILRRIMFENKDGASKSGKSWYEFTMCYLKVSEPEGSNLSQYFKTSKFISPDKHKNILRYLHPGAPNSDKFRACLDRLESKCRASKVRVTKVLRLSLRLLPRLLTQFPNLKVMFIVRDPRGNLNSRIQTSWFPVNGNVSTEVRDNIRSLCFKMEEDVEMVESLIRHFPGRFVDLRLEDVVKVPTSFDNIFGILNLTLSDNHKKLIRGLFVERPNFETKWKTSLKDEYIRMAEGLCGKVFKFYNYKRISY